MKRMAQLSDWRIINADVIVGLQSLKAESVQCVISSPPYWGLRDYGACNCVSGRYDLGQGNGTGGDMNYRSNKADPNCEECDGTGRTSWADDQFGLEKTPEEYVDKMVAVFREVRRVLRDDGTIWLNLGDSYISGKSRYSSGPQEISGRKSRQEPAEGKKPDLYYHETLKEKDLCMMPARVALALQADGWWVRSDIIWSKPNPMPESVTDRPTKAHEYMFLLTKSVSYYYDADAIAEPLETDPSENYPDRSRILGRGEQGGSIARGNDRDKSGGFPPRKRSGNIERKENHQPNKSSFGRSFPWEGDTRNKRSVWTVPTVPYPGPHYATFPPKLIEPCILAGSAKNDLIVDPFCGTGVTGMVALWHGRRFIGIDLDPKSYEMAHNRIDGDCPLFNRSEDD